MPRKRPLIVFFILYCNSVFVVNVVVGQCIQTHWFVSHNNVVRQAPVYTISSHISNWKCILQVNRMRMRSPSSTHSTLFVIALSLQSTVTNPFLRFIYRYYLFPVTIDYHLLLSKINCLFLLWEKNQSRKANWCLSQWCIVENEERGREKHQYQQQQQKCAIHVTVFLSRTK